MKTTTSVKNRNRILGEILPLLKASRTFFLSGHQNPDPDTIGSELALRSFLLRLDRSKKIDVINTHPLPTSLKFLAGASTVKTARRIDKRYDCAVIMECANSERMGNIIDLKSQAKHVINIDHHLHNSEYGDVNLIDPKASSNAEQIFHLLEYAGKGITPQEATALYAGLVTDTGRFQYSNTRPESHRVAARLIECGAEASQACEKIYMEKPLGALKLLAYALTHLKLLAQGRIALITLTPEAFKKTGASSEDTEEIVNYGLYVPSVKASALLKTSDRPAEVKVSLRGKGNTDVNQVARFFGGGGHKKASGCAIRGSLEDAVQRVIQRLKLAVR
jgi:phosphoesterase RecJ-like protein